MSNEEFQKLVLEKLSTIDTDIKDIKEDISELKTDMKYVKNKVDGIEERVIKNSEFVYNVVQVAKNSNVE
jgi:cell division septum initiation protein DivIVA